MHPLLVMHSVPPWAPRGHISSSTRFGCFTPAATAAAAAAGDKVLVHRGADDEAGNDGVDSNYNPFVVCS